MTGNSRPQSAKIVGSARNATRVLAYLAEKSAPVRLADVAGALGINTSTCFNILHTLTEDGFVASRDRTYGLGPEAVNFAYRVTEAVDNLSRVQMLAERFSREHGVNVLLWRIEGAEAVAIGAFRQSSSSSPFDVTVRGRMPMLTGSVGRVVAAFGGLGNEHLQAEFEAANWRNLTFDRFLAQAEDAKRTGYAIECGDVAEGVHAMAVPILAPDGSLDRVLSINALARDLPTALMPALGEALIELAKAIDLRTSLPPLPRPSYGVS